MARTLHVQALDWDPRLNEPMDGASEGGALEGADVEVAADTLYRAEKAIGNVTYDAAELEFYRYAGGQHRFDLAVQFNPGRARRPFSPKQCPVCLATIRKMGAQHYVCIGINGRPYVMLANIFPVMPGALVIVSAEHLSQDLNEYPERAREIVLRKCFSDMVALAKALPDHVVFFNGRLAGASLAHLHFQAFRLPEGYGPLALQRASGNGEVRWIGFDQDYPLAVHCANGAADGVIADSVEVASVWRTVQGAAASANVIAIAAASGVSLYFVARNGLFRVGLLGAAHGAIEAAGLAICSSVEDRARIRSGEVTFELLWRNLSFVRPAAAAAWRERCEG